MFVLGATYLKLRKQLGLQMPVIDPSLFISRFAALLEFGEETQKVAQDAVRLVSRMQRDWMDTGRRPSGLCGACLLLAARMNNFRRSIAEIIQVVKIGDVTLRKRLEEFRNTPSGELTVQDFRTIWLDETADPPAFTRNQKKEQKEREKQEERQRKREAGLPNDEESGGEEEEEVAKLLAKVKKTADEDEQMADEPAEDADEEEEEEEPPLIPIPAKSAKALGKRKERDHDDDDSDSEAAANERARLQAEKEAEAALLEPRPNLDAAILSELGQTLNSQTGLALQDELDKREKGRLITSAALTNVTLDTSNELDNLDEDELDRFILTEKEVEVKTRVWMEANVKYLQMLADKQTGPDGELRPQAAPRTRKRNKPKDSSTATGGNAAEAAKTMLSKKRFSKKINYAAIDELFKDVGSNAGSKPGTPRDQVDDDDDSDSDASDEDEEDGRQAAGGSRSRSRSVGRPIVIPAPTFGGSRAGTPARAHSKKAAEPQVEEDEEEEEEEPEEDDEGEAWRHLTAQGEEDGEQYGYDEV